MNIISLEHVTSCIYGVQPLKDISLSIPKGAVTGIFGASGSGKTTLLFLVCGLIKPDKGTIRIDSVEPTDRNRLWNVARRSMAVSLQYPEDMLLHDTVAQEFQEALKGMGVRREGIEAIAIEMLEWAGLPPAAFFPMHPQHLSQGQMRRLSLALVRAQARDIIILDEPTLGLDCNGKKGVLYPLIESSRKEGKTCIIFSHDTPALLSLIDRGILLNDGEVVLQGERKKLLDHWEQVIDCGLSLPPLAHLASELKKAGIPITRIWEDLDQATEDLATLFSV